MAVAHDTTVSAGRQRGAGSGIVVAGDRTVSRLLARRHSLLVKYLKITLPLTALAIAGGFTASILDTTGWGSGVAEIAMPQILPESLKMDNPHYEGFNADGGRYWVKAQSARQDLKALGKIQLETITGELIDAKKQITKLSAARGTFDNKASVLELYDAIDVGGDAGLSAKMTRATIDTKQGLITSDQPVTVGLSAAEVTADQMKVRQKSKEYTFLENVKARVTPPDAKADAKTDAAAAPAFGEPGQPIDITANRLDIDDAKKTALFTGQVVAVQGGASMTSPDLTVTYVGDVGGPGGSKGDAKTGAKGGEESASGGKVKTIAASDPVVLKQADGSTVNARSALFDAVDRTAVLTGDIVMSQGADKRAMGDRVDFDETTNTVTLTGAVAVTQGMNELKGRKLVFNRGTNEMQLTGNDGTTAATRISARFQQAANKSKPTDAPAQAAGNGIKFGATFKTDPNAPVQVEADRLDVDDRAKRATFTGDVRAKQGEFMIRSAELVANYSGSTAIGGTTGDAAKAGAAPAQLTRISARKKVQVTSKDQNATGDWAEFDAKANTATLGGDVVLTQGKNVVRGTKLVIDMTTGESTIRNDGGTPSSGGAKISSSGGDGNGTAQKSSRPSAVFYPNEFKGQNKSQGSKSKKDSLDGWEARSGE